MVYPLEEALEKYETGSIPEWGEAEAPIDEITWETVESDTSDFPGGGLSRCDMLYIGEGHNRMYIVRGGKIIWTYDAGKGYEYDDVWMLSNGNILFSRMYWAAEITPDKRFVWRMDAPEGTEIHTLQPIDEERNLLVLNALPLPKLLIINRRTGETEYEHEIPYAPAHMHGQFRRFRLTEQGTYLASCLEMGKVIEFDRDFNEIWSYDIEGAWAAVRLANGNTLITGEKEGVTREVRPDGSTAWEFYLDDVPEKWRPDGTQSCVRLDNGNTLICSRGGNGKTPQLIEVTPEKEIVWVLKDWKNLGPCTAVQVLTEKGIPEMPGQCMR